MHKGRKEKIASSFLLAMTGTQIQEIWEIKKFYHIETYIENANKKKG